MQPHATPATHQPAKSEGPPAHLVRPSSILSLWLISTILSLLTLAFLWVSFSPGAPDAFLYDKFVFAWELLAALLMSFFPVLVIAHLLMTRKRFRTAWTVFILGQWLLCAYLIADMSIYRITSNHLDAYFMFLFQPQLLTIGGGAGLLVRRVIELLALAGAVTLVSLSAGRLLALWLARRDPSRRRIYIAPAAYVLCVVSVALGQRYVHSYPHLYDFVQSLPFDLSRLGLGPVPPDSSAFSSALSQTMKQTVSQWSRAAAPTMHGPPVRITRANPPNVVILVVDSLRRDMFDPQYMPRLHAHAQEGMVFLNHKPGVNGTPWAMYDITYAQYSMYLRSSLDRDVKPALPAIFNRSGYQSLYLEGVDDSHFLDMWKYVGPGSGFDQTIIRHHGNHWDVADKDILRYISDDLAHASRPQMVLTLLLSVHYPYYYPPAFQKLTPVMDTHAKVVTDMNPKTDRTPLFNRYKNAVAYEDHLIGDFLDRIDLNHTVVVVLGDHGESFWEDGHLSHAGPMSRIVMSTPCVWIGAGVPRRQINMITQHVDLLPTLLHIVQGAPLALTNVDGMDILDNLTPRQAWIACPPSNDAHGLTFIINRPEDGIQLYWSDEKRQLLYEGKITTAGQFLPYSIPAVDQASSWGAQIDSLLARRVR